MSIEMFIDNVLYTHFFTAMNDWKYFKIIFILAYGMYNFIIILTVQRSIEKVKPVLWIYNVLVSSKNNYKKHHRKYNHVN